MLLDHLNPVYRCFLSNVVTNLIEVTFITGFVGAHFFNSGFQKVNRLLRFFLKWYKVTLRHKLYSNVFYALRWHLLRVHKE